jgi:hypothetical protein
MKESSPMKEFYGTHLHLRLVEARSSQKIDRHLKRRSERVRKADVEREKERT